MADLTEAPYLEPLQDAGVVRQAPTDVQEEKAPVAWQLPPLPLALLVLVQLVGSADSAWLQTWLRYSALDSQMKEREESER